MNDDLLLIEIERLRQMLRIAAVDVSRLAGCDAGDYGTELVMLKGFSGGFWTKYLQKVNV